MPNSQLTLVVPCLNEEDNVAKLAERFFVVAVKRGIRAEILFVDDGSTDDTWLNITALCQKFEGQIKGIRHNRNLGIVESWLTGIRNAESHTVCLIDCDLQNPPEEVVRLFQIYEETGCDLVRAVRNPSQRNLGLRFVLSRCLNGILNCLFSMKSRDNKSGFLLARTDILAKLMKDHEKFRHFQTFVGVAANFQNLNTVEIDTPFYPRQHGRSFLSGKLLRVTVDALKDLPIAFRRFR